MDEDGELYILGRMAQWAGDFEFALDCFKRLAPLGRFGAMPDEMAGPADVMRFAAALRARQMTQRRAEFQRFNEQNMAHYEDVELDYQPPVFKGDRIRATLWWIEPRLIEVRAFPLSREAAGEVLHAAHRTTQEFRGIQFEGSDRFWIASSTPYTTCNVTPLGMVWCESLWTSRDTPVYEHLANSVKEALAHLDPSLAQQLAT